MSYTTVLGLTPKDTSSSAVYDIEELHNSHASAPVIWDAMCQKYLGTEPYGYMFSIDQLWPIYKDLSIPEYRRAVLVMTYDRAYVSKENYKRAASDIRTWLEHFPPKEGYVNHWVRIAEIFESEPDCEAIGLHCTSVSENPFMGEWNEEKEEYDPIDWDTAFEIYEELDSLK